MKSNQLMHMLPAVILITLLSLYCGGPESGAPESTDTGPARVAFQVVSGPARTDSISEYYDYAGTVRSYQNQVIIPEVAGRITLMAREAGDPVQQGELLFRINDVIYRSQYEQAEAQLKSARIACEDARKNRQRMENVYRKEGVSKTQYEQAVKALEMAENALKQAEAAYRVARFNMESTAVKAPFSGVVTARNNQEGDYINPAMSMGVYTLENYRRVYVDVDVPLTEARDLERNMPADILLNSNPLEARILSINKKTDPRSSSVLLTLVADNPEKEVLPGRVVTVRVHYRQVDNAVVIPADALLEEDVVFVREKDRARKRTVSVGLVNERFVQVVTGIEAGESVIYEGNFGLFDGAPVEEKK